MSVALLRMALVATGLTVAFVVASAGFASAATIAFPAIQNGWSVYAPSVESQSGSYIRLAGAPVRDHRSNSGGSYNTNTTPLSAVSPGRGEGGVYPMNPVNPRDHRKPIFIFVPPGGK
jgi:hypothetical protein